MSKKILSIVLVTSLVSFGQVQAGLSEAWEGLKEGWYKTAVEVETPEVVVDDSLVVIETPAVEVEAPSVLVEMPVVEVEAPSGLVEKPAVTTPVVEVKTLVVGVEAPAVEVDTNLWSSAKDTISENKKASIFVAVSALVVAGYYLDGKYRILDRASNFLGLNDEDEDDNEDELEVV